MININKHMLTLHEINACFTEQVPKSFKCVCRCSKLCLKLTRLLCKQSGIKWLVWRHHKSRTTHPKHIPNGTHTHLEVTSNIKLASKGTHTRNIRTVCVCNCMLWCVVHTHKDTCETWLWHTQLTITHTRTQPPRHTDTRLPVHTNTHTYTRLCLCAHVTGADTQTHTLTHTCIYITQHKDTTMHAHTHTHTNTNVNTHTHTYALQC